MREKITIKNEEQMNAYIQRLEEFRLTMSPEGEMDVTQLDEIKDILIALVAFTQNNTIDPRLLAIFIVLLGRILQQIGERKQEEEIEKEWEELSEKEKQVQMRFVIYEIYKLLNPRQIAGETELENFINNVKARGIEVALEYASDSILQKFQKSGIDIAAIESDKALFVEALAKGGHKGGGRGL